MRARARDNSFWRFLGVEVEAAREGWVRLRVPARDELRNAAGAPVHGGVYAALTDMAVGGALALYGPTSALPDPDNRGPVYQKYSAGELDLYASRATPVAISLLLQYRVGKGATLWLSGRTERLSSSESVPLSSFSPGGSRTATSIGGGVTLR